MTKLVSGRLKAQPAAGPHPAPELLSAFAEDALSAAERGQLLQHLGACSDCREILYLALPDSPEAQKVLVLQPRPFTFRRWALGWGALAASLAIIAIFVTTDRWGLKKPAAPMVATTPAAATETKVIVEKTPSEIGQMRAERDVGKNRVLAAPGVPEAKPQPEAKHMTAKLQPHLVFEPSGEVRMQAPVASANAVGGPVSRDVGRDKDAKQKEAAGGAAFHGFATQAGAAGKPGDLAYAAPVPSQARADQPAATAEAAALSTDSASGLKSLPINARNALSLSRPTRELPVKGALGGIVVDPSGAVVSDAKITVTGPIGEKIATSDAEGRFSFDLLTPGSYSVKAEARGFRSTEIRQVAVLGNKPAALQVRLDVGSSSEAVAVSAEAPSVDKATGASPVLNSNTGFVVARQQTAPPSARKAAAANSPPPGIGGGGGGAGAATFQWALSPEGAVQRSGDSGKTWQVVSVTTGATFRALSAAGANIWVGGKAGALYHSADFGQTWAMCEPVAGTRKLDQDIVRVDFSDGLSGTVSTANGEVWATSDGGQTWQHK